MQEGCHGEGRNPAVRNYVMALHAEYVNSQIAALTEQGKELGERVAKMTRQGSKRTVATE